MGDFIFVMLVLIIVAVLGVGTITVATYMSQERVYVSKSEDNSWRECMDITPSSVGCKFIAVPVEGEDENN